MQNDILVSTRKGLFHLVRAGDSWNLQSTSFLGENVTLAYRHPSGAWFAALNLGHFGIKLKRSNDYGQTWSECAVPAYPEGEVVSTNDGKPPQPASLKLIWAFAHGGVNYPERIWLGTAPGGLFHSDDLGQSWHINRALWDHPSRSKWFGGGLDTPGIHSICVDPRDSNRILLAVSCSGVWESCDGGQSWIPKSDGMFAEYMPPELKYEPTAQDPHMLVMCPNQPDFLWVQHHNGVFRSTNGGAQWHHVPNAKPTGFGFGVAVDPNDGNSAWFVPAIKDERRIPIEGQFVVSRTRDGGNAFEVLRSGLPQSAAYDIVLRHALSIDDTGHKLVIGSTTGGLWTTVNNGDTWQQNPIRFPPIHATLWIE